MMSTTKRCPYNPNTFDMKRVPLILTIVLSLFLAVNSSAQQSDEDTILKLEEAERYAIEKRDTATLSSLMSRKIVVQNPENAVVGFRQIMNRIRNGKIHYSSFQRRIENIAFVNNIAIVMGQETLVAQGATKNAGRTITRRFTNIWTKENGAWKLTARQATITSIK
jgi:ketosteroid isomerase-like protein